MNKLDAKNKDAALNIYADLCEGIFKNMIR